jgi:hypothetical protein
MSVEEVRRERFRPKPISLAHPTFLRCSSNGRNFVERPAFNRQMVDILAAVLADGLPAVEAACAEAIAEGIHSADVILNILAGLPPCHARLFFV